MCYFYLICFGTVGSLILIYFVLRLKGIEHWFIPYLIGEIREYFPPREYPQDIYFCLVDHFEPKFNEDPPMKIVDYWCEEYPKIALKHSDSSGNSPKHTFFVPLEQYNPDATDRLAKLCAKGVGDVEIHLHHDNDSPSKLRNTLINFKKIFHDKHGLLRKDPDKGDIIYSFIHGNWALDNSRVDGKWCGVNNEINILKETGCYADFTMPSGSGSTQTKTINSIYYAVDNPEKPKSHDSGIPMAIGLPPPENALLMIQGPLTLNWKNRKYGIFPRIEDSNISASNPPTGERIDLWIKQRIRPKGDNKSIIVKVHTHGAQKTNAGLLLDSYLDSMYSYLETNYNDGEKYRLFYVTSFELYNILKSIEKGVRKIT